MKTEKPKKLIRWYILGAIGAVLMAAGDWLLGYIPLQQTDTGLFNRAYYLSGSYGLWKPVLTVGLGAIGGFLYYFVVKALNADIDTKYRKTKIIQYLCGIFTVVMALAPLKKGAGLTQPRLKSSVFLRGRSGVRIPFGVLKRQGHPKDGPVLFIRQQEFEQSKRNCRWQFRCGGWTPQNHSVPNPFWRAKKAGSSKGWACLFYT